MGIEQLKEVTDEFLIALERLMPQLTTFSPIPSRQLIEHVLANPGTSLWISRDDHHSICGMLTLVIYSSPTGKHAWIEDVVVDENNRGQGHGKKITQAALDHAHTQGVKAVSLTSRPNRIAANHLYQKMGFELQETNTYRYHFPASPAKDKPDDQNF
jgi:ribosomal protein S18 acetylase RimI-like enzyme